MADSPLKRQITDDMKAAMRAQEKERLSTIRLILAAIKQREVDERIELSDTDVLTVLDKMLKQRRESITQYEQAGRTDLADREKAEMSILQAYLPAQLGAAEIDRLIDEAIAASGATTIKDMGKVMAQLKPQLQGRADIGAVSGQIKTKLAP